MEKVLGVGGMGMVVAAMHLELEQRVALKFMLPGAMPSQMAVDRFLREAKAAVRLRSEHICRVLDVGKLDDGAPYIVMELMAGQDFAALLAQRGPLAHDEAISYVLQALEGVAEAHANGIVHRDLKPANLFITTDNDGTPLVKVLDFGVSKAADTAATKTGDVVGSPAYMAPEQMRSSKDADARSDVWALGVILYQAITNRLPFNGQTLPELCVALLEQHPPTPLDLRPNMPPGLSGVIMRCLEKDPARRCPDVATLAKLLVPFGRADAARIAARTAKVLNRGEAPPPSARDGIAPTVLDPTGSSPQVTPVPATIMESGPQPRGIATGPAAYAPTHGPPASAVAQSATTPVATVMAASTTLGTSSGQSIAAVVASTQPTARRSSWLPFAGVVLLLGAIGITAAVMSSGDKETKPTAAQPTALVAPGSAAPTTPPATPTAPIDAGQVAPPRPATKVQIILETNPPGADVFQEPDNVRVGRTPFKRALAPVENGVVVYSLRLKGYEDERVEVAADRDDERKLELRPLSHTSSTTTKTGTRPTTTSTTTTTPTTVKPTTTNPTTPTRPTGPSSDGMLTPTP